MKKRDSKPLAELPVSRKYYKSLEAHLVEIVEAIRGYRDDEWIEFVMSMIDAYLRGSEQEFYVSGRASVECEVICLTLKAEIDRAVERSRRARERAARRRADKQSKLSERSESSELSDLSELSELSGVSNSSDSPPSTDSSKPCRSLGDAYRAALDAYARRDRRIIASRYCL
ncbi:MAG: hypothetical protein K2K72_07745, partial [Duncaniella sp.]|nr:hypothetical protein [Duncaniella sp.]